MGLIREPEGVDFVICSKPLTPEGAADITEFIQQSKERRSKELLELLEAFSMRLTPADRTRLAHQLIDSLTAPPPIAQPATTTQARAHQATLAPKKTQPMRRKTTQSPH